VLRALVSNTRLYENSIGFADKNDPIYYDSTKYKLFRCILFHANLRKDTRAERGSLKLRNRSAIILAHTWMSVDIWHRYNFAARSVRARSQRIRSHAFAFHARDPIRTTTVKARAASMSASATSGIRALAKSAEPFRDPRPDREISPSSPDRDVRASRLSRVRGEFVKSVKRRLCNGVI